MNVTWQAVATRWGFFVAAACGVVWVAMSGCDRDDEDEAGTDTEEHVEVESSANGDEETSELGAAYADLEDVEPLEPQDAGPEGDAVYFLSGLKGYTEPCGCTVDVMLGGIDRIAAFVEDAKAMHGTAHFVDAGDWLFESAQIPEYLEPQERAKAKVLAAAYRQMDALLSVPGDRDLALGVEFYQSMMDEAQMTPLGANIEFDGQPLKASKDVNLGDGSVRYVGLGDPDLYADIEGVSVTDETEAITRAIEGAEDQAVILIYQGSPLRAEVLAEEFDAVDFVIVGHDPRLDDDARRRGSAYLIESYDQGRYVGRLKLYGLEHESGFVDGRQGIREQRRTIDHQIDGVRRDLRLLEVRTKGADSPMSQRLEERLTSLQQRRRELLREGIEIPDQRRAFLYEPIAMEPGYRLHEVIRDRRQAYNRSLAQLNADIDRDPIPTREGEPFYVGTPQCATCHVEAKQFWDETAHASAVATLEQRHKKFDQNCIGCHVVGWEQPGGSVLGKLQYEVELAGESFAKDLRDVGCESCHGPGSKHRVEPLDEKGQPQHINRHPDERACTTCHVPDHSPTFDFDVYVEQITGPGHEYSGAP